MNPAARSSGHRGAAAHARRIGIGANGDPVMYDDDDDDDGGRFSRRRRAPEPVKRGIAARLGLWLVGAVISGVVPLFVALWALSAARDYAPMLARPTAAAALGSAAVVTLTFSVALFVEFYLYWKMGPSE